MRNRRSFTEFSITLSCWICCTLIISACSNKPSPAQQTSIAGALTSVVQTATAQATSFTPTILPTLTFTQTPVKILTPTKGKTATSAPAERSSATATLISNICDHAIYVRDVTIPDGTALAPDQTFVKTWEIQNVGSCTWTTSYDLFVTSGAAMSGETTALTRQVMPGETVQISVGLKAPSAEGEKKGYWRMQNASGIAFGQILSVVIVVSKEAYTATPTPTETDEPDETATPTATAVPTETPTPVITSTTAPTGEVTETPTTGLAGKKTTPAPIVR